MLIPAVQFCAGALLRSDIDTDSLGPARGAPALFLIRKRDLPGLKLSGAPLNDRGATGKPGRQLSRYLLGRDGIPVVEGKYTAAGRLRQSVLRFLAHAEAARECKIYLLTAEDPLFDALWGEAADPRDASLALPPACEPARRLLDLLPARDVPATVLERFAGDSLDAELVRRLILQATDTDDPVLILGETGTGKELVARAIHEHHPKRRFRGFIAINCGAIPDELLESELFGHCKGTFTGAVTDKKGLWEEADGGTLFLDEIGDLPLDQQAKILRALQHGEVRRLGANTATRVDARVIAATNRDVVSMVRARLFREDLYQRLCGLVIHTPPLGEHPEEIARLAKLFWKTIATGGGALPQDVFAELEAHRWRGNVRELKKVLRNLYTLFGGDGLRAEHVRAVFEIRERVMSPGTSAPDAIEIQLHRVECLRHLRRASELVRCCELALEPASNSTPGAAPRAIDALQRAIRPPLRELEALCSRPLLFHRQDAYRAIAQLTGKLSEIETRSRAQARQALLGSKETLPRALRAASAALFRAAGGVLAAVDCQGSTGGVHGA